MPYRDPDARKAYSREYVARNKAKKALYDKARRTADAAMKSTKRARAWKEAHPERSNASNRKSAEKQRLFISDSYVRKTLSIGGVSTKQAPPELITLKREQLEIYRLTKQLNKIIKEKQRE